MVWPRVLPIFTRVRQAPTHYELLTYHKRRIPVCPHPDAGDGLARFSGHMKPDGIGWEVVVKCRVLARVVGMEIQDGNLPASRITLYTRIVAGHRDHPCNLCRPCWLFRAFGSDVVVLEKAQLRGRNRGRP